MGVVYEAKDELLKKTVAIKTIRRGFLKAEHIIRFQKEAKALASLNHSGLVPLYIFGLTEDNDPFMVMRFEKGKTLADLIEARGRLPLFKSLSIFIQIADAMKHAHEHGVLHRDLKPGNIMVTGSPFEAPSVIVLDFGVAMVNEEDAIDRLTKTGVIIGTPTYMSPEQVKGRDIDARSDIYSLGCIMYETLTGKPPLMASTALELLTRKTSEPAPSLNQEPSEAKFPSGIAEIVAKCLAVDPADRYESMSKLKDDLLAFRAGDYVTQGEITAGESFGKPASKKNVLLAFGISLAGVLLAASILALAVEVLRQTSEPEARVNPAPAPEIDQSRAKLNVVRPYATQLAMSYLTSDREFFKNLKKYPLQYDIDTKESKVKGEGFNELSPSRREKIVSLSFTQCVISQKGLEEMSGLPNLQTLQLRRENLSRAGLASLAKAKKLRALDIEGSSLEDGALEEILRLKNLDELRLNNIEEVDDAFVAEVVAKLPHLRQISLQDTSVSRKCLESLSKKGSVLEYINLNFQGDLTNNDVKVLSKFTALRSLEIRGSFDVTDEGLNCLLEAKSLQRLRISSTMGTAGCHAMLKQRIAEFKVIYQDDVVRRLENRPREVND